MRINGYKNHQMRKMVVFTDFKELIQNEHRHFHPSGDPTPSIEDERTTERIAKAGDLIGIKLLDHIIIGPDDKYYSFGEEGKL